MIILWKIKYADYTDCCAHDRVVYLDTKQLSFIDKTLVEIALKKQEIFGNSKLFVPLRGLFNDFSDDIISLFYTEDSTWVRNLYSIYTEDLHKNEITSSQFQDILNGKKISLPAGYSCFDNRPIPFEDITRYIIWQKQPLRKDYFSFSSNEIEILNLFCENAKQLQASNLFEPSNISLSFTGDAKQPYRECKVTYNIISSDIRSAYMYFRLLVMEKEPACYFKVKKIILNSQKNQHGSFSFLKSLERKIDALWHQKNHPLPHPLAIILYNAIPELKNICWGKLIKTNFNHGLFHQKNPNSTEIQYREFEKLINNKELFDAIIFIGVCTIAKMLCDFANYIVDILTCYLDKKIIFKTEYSHPTEAQKEFKDFTAIP